MMKENEYWDIWYKMKETEEWKWTLVSCCELGCCYKSVLHGIFDKVNLAFWINISGEFETAILNDIRDIIEDTYNLLKYGHLWGYLVKYPTRAEAKKWAKQYESK